MYIFLRTSNNKKSKLSDLKQVTIDFPGPYLDVSIRFKTWDVFSLALIYCGLFLFSSASCKKKIVQYTKINNDK